MTLAWFFQIVRLSRSRDGLAALLPLFLGGILFPAMATAQSPNPGDPLYCQPVEGVHFLIVNGGSGIFTVDYDCFNNNINNDTQTTITTTQGGTLTLNRTAYAGNYTYTPPTPTFTGLDTFQIGVTTVWNSAGGAGSAGGTSRPGGAATLTITLNVLPATATMTAAGATLVPVPPGSITGCSAPGNGNAGPVAGAVYSCVTGVVPGTTAPSHGTLTRVGNNLRYTPTAGYGGTDTFNYRAVGVDNYGTTSLNSGDILMTVTVIPAPTVTSVSPSTGPAAGGTAVTITGSAAAFTVVNDTTITATTPSGPPGQTVSVAVTTPSGTSAANSLFQYQAQVPTLTEWGMGAMALLLAFYAWRCLHRKGAPGTA